MKLNEVHNIDQAMSEGTVYDMDKEYGAPAPKHKPVIARGASSRYDPEAVDPMHPDQRRFQADQDRYLKAQRDAIAKMKAEKGMDEALAMGMEEEFIGEPHHDGSTFKNSLHTIHRVAVYLNKNISADDDIPEWVAEKMGAAKGMLTSVMQYLISEKEMHRGESGMFEQSVAEGSLNEFAVEPSDGDSDDEYDLLVKLVKLWWLGNAQQHAKAEKTLASMGISIDEDEPNIILRRGTQFLTFPMDDFQQGVAEGSGGDWYAMALKRHPQLKQVDREKVIDALNDAYEDYLFDYGYEGIGPDEENSLIDYAVKRLKQGVAQRMPQGNYSDEAHPIRDDGNEPPDYAAMYESKLMEFAGGMGAGSVASVPAVGKGSNVGSLFGGSYSQKNSPFKKTKAKKESVIKR